MRSVHNYCGRSVKWRGVAAFQIARWRRLNRSENWTANAGTRVGAAVASGLIADVLLARGDLDEALRIRREEELPVYERLGDVRAKAVTMGQIADVLQARGDLDEALRIRREEQLPVYERLGGRDLIIGRGKLAITLLTRNNTADREEARGLLCLALADARRMRLPEAAQIEAIPAKPGLSCD